MIYPAPADETTDWAQRGSQSRAFPEWKPGDPVRVLSPETLREMPVAEAALVLGLLWAALSNPKFMAQGPKAGQPSDEMALEDDPEELTRALQTVPAPMRDAILQALRDRRAARRMALAILRAIKAHSGPERERPIISAPRVSSCQHTTVAPTRGSPALVAMGPPRRTRPD